MERAEPLLARTKPTCFAAEVIHLPVEAFSSLNDSAVAEVRLEPCGETDATDAACLVDAKVGDMKRGVLALDKFSFWEGALVGY